ncbi:uncharacterized protein PV07_09962 [Cladophialophora immunda]|uniref:Methyltransferase domain-containing protein n=1 Tax=Cladophialophora immunda TaxID=569365 RepID=A0A0D2CL00_9EURO|nr:uncharacterized protein PV07_09962 [Cladophialophora immunda]KIW24234.1 hypothetical protein PV07_09962 [Cladophialophora immunda]
MADQEDPVADEVNEQPVIAAEEDEGVGDWQYQRYRDGEYHRPNDEEELKRLDLMDEMFFLINKRRLHLAPIGNLGLRVLDIGFGTGTWTIAMGDTYPQAEIIGSTSALQLPNGCLRTRGSRLQI